MNLKYILLFLVSNPMAFTAYGITEAFEPFHSSKTYQTTDKDVENAGAYASSFVYKLVDNNIESISDHC